jgi:hypothetical protein
LKLLEELLMRILNQQTDSKIWCLLDQREVTSIFPRSWLVLVSKTLTVREFHLDSTGDHFLISVRMTMDPTVRVLFQTVMCMDLLLKSFTSMQWEEEKVLSIRLSRLLIQVIFREDLLRLLKMFK